MKVLLIYPFSGTWEISPKRPLHTDAYLPPLGLLYLGKILEERGDTVEVIDCNAEGIHEEHIKAKVLSSDVVGMTLYSKPREMENSIRLAAFIKQCDPNVPLVVGGPHSTIQPKHALEVHHADICVQGEGEMTIGPVMQYLEGKTTLQEIPGVSYRKQGKIISTGSPQEIDNLDTIPFPARHLVEHNEYGYMMGVKLVKGKLTSLLCSRGCPARCSYCQLSTLIPRYRMRSVENITKEIDEVIHSGYDTIVFADDNFFVHKKKVEEILEYIINHKYDIRLWVEGARVDAADRELYTKFRRAGGEVISYGIESGNQDVLDFYNKHITVSQIRNAVNLSRKAGLFVHASYILGAPIETRKHLINTIRFARSLPTNAASFYTLGLPYGCPLWHEAVKEGKITPDDYWVDSIAQLGMGHFTKEELVEFGMKAHRNFYFNPRLWLREVVHSLRSQDFRYFKLGVSVMTRK